MRKSETIGALMGALGKLHRLTSGQASEGGHNPHFGSRYTRLSDMWAAVAPHMEECGLGFVQSVEGRDDSGEYLTVDSLLGHTSGEWVEGTTRVRVDDRQNGAQADGSAATYARRYAGLSMLGLAPDDDDGEAASPHDGQTPKAAPAARGNAPATLPKMGWLGDDAGKPIAQVEAEALRRFAEWKRGKLDPSSRYHEGDLRLLAAIDAELAARVPPSAVKPSDAPAAITEKPADDVLGRTDKYGNREFTPAGRRSAKFREDTPAREPAQVVPLHAVPDGPPPLDDEDAPLDTEPPPSAAAKPTEAQNKEIRDLLVALTAGMSGGAKRAEIARLVRKHALCDAGEVTVTTAGYLITGLKGELERKVGGGK